MYCAKCNAFTSDDARFCGNCGDPVPDEDRGVPDITSSEDRGVFTSPPSPPLENSRGGSADEPSVGHQSWGPQERPSFAPTVLVTIFFGIFGLIPALRHSHMARERGYSTSGYWWAFWLPILIPTAVLVLVFVTLVVETHQINSAIAAGSNATAPGSARSSTATRSCSNLNTFVATHPDSITFSEEHASLITSLLNPANAAVLDAVSSNPSQANINAAQQRLGPEIFAQLIKYQSQIKILIYPYESSLRDWVSNRVRCEQESGG